MSYSIALNSVRYIICMCNFERCLAWYLTRRNDNSLYSVLDLIMVYYYVHSKSKFAESIQSIEPLFQDTRDADYKISQNIQIQAIRAYMEAASLKSLKIHSALESYLEFREKSNLKDVHNVN